MFLVFIADLIHIEAGIASRLFAGTALDFVEGRTYSCFILALQGDIVLSDTAGLAACALRCEGVASQHGFHRRATHSCTACYLVFLERVAASVLCVVLFQYLVPEVLYVAHIGDVLSRNAVWATLILVLLLRFVSLRTYWAYWGFHLYLSRRICRVAGIFHLFTTILLAILCPCFTNLIELSIMVTCRAHCS